MLNRVVLLAFCVFGVAFAQTAPTVRSDQSYTEVLNRVANAQLNITLLVSSPDRALVDMLALAANTFGGPLNSAEQGGVYLIRGGEPVLRETDLARAGVQVKTFGQDFPQSLIVVDFKTVMAANLPENVDGLANTALGDTTWEIVDFDEPVYTVVADLTSYWHQAQVPR